MECCQDWTKTMDGQFYTMPFSSDEVFVCLIDGHALESLSFNPGNTPYSGPVLDSLRNRLASFQKISYHLMLMPALSAPCIVAHYEA